MKIKVKTSHALLSLMLLASVTAPAATVAFSGANYTDGLVSTNGTSVSAFNFGADADIASDPTVVNTVSFATYNPGDGSVSGFVHNGADGSGANGAGDNTTLTLSGVFHTAGTNGHLQYSGLTIGQQYEVQMVFSDTRGILTPDLMQIWDTATPGGAADFTTADIATAQIVTGTFTANASTQDFYLTQSTGVGDFDGYIGAIQLRAVPEPSSTALLGLGGLALIFDQKASPYTSPPSEEKSTPSSRGLHIALTAGLALVASLNLFFYAKTRPAALSDTPPPNLLSILPATPEDWHVDTSTDLYQFSGILQTDNLAQRTYRRMLNGKIAIFTVYLAYWQPGQSSVSQVSMHTPDACWPGSGWNPVEIPSRQESLAIKSRLLPTAESRKFSSGKFAQHVWFWHIYDGRPIDFKEPRSAAELLRHAWRYGFTNESDQLFARFSSNLTWDELREEPLLDEIFANLKPLGL